MISCPERVPVTGRLQMLTAHYFPSKEPLGQQEGSPATRKADEADCQLGMVPRLLVLHRLELQGGGEGIYELSRKQPSRAGG